MLDFLMPYLNSPITWISFTIGLFIGSFLNVCIYRIPEKTFWSSHRSFCRHCHQPIPFYLNIPIISFIMLGSKTKCCKKAISLQYPLVELLAGITLTTIYWHFPFMGDFGGRILIDFNQLIRFLHAAIFVNLLILCAIIDIKHMIIPDVIDLPMIALTPLVVYFHPELDWKSAGIGVLAGGGSLYLIAWIYWLIRREIGLGMGDVKLLAAIGGWLGYQAIFPVIIYGSVLGSLFGLTGILLSRKLGWRSAIPFGPFLAIGAIAHLLFGHIIQEVILKL